MHQPKIITWQEYVDMKTTMNTKDDAVPLYIHKDGIIAKAKRDFQLRMLALDGWLSYVEDTTKELENSMDIERNLRMNAISEIEKLENEIKLLEEDPDYIKLCCSNDTKDKVENKVVSPKQSIPKLAHTTIHGPTGTYTGDRIHGYRDGLGRMVYPEGDAQYRKEYMGEWKRDLCNGKGKMIFTNGDSYEGWWKDDQIHGHGIYKWENGNIYDGHWSNGNMHGEGVFQYADGDMYSGNFDNDYRHGVGTLISQNGTKYEGEWNKNYRHGFGILTLPTGEIYEGEFKDNYYID